MYADDIISISQTKYGVEKMLETTSVYPKKWKIQMNKKKTNSMVIDNSKSKNNKIKIEIDGHELERVKNIKYLGFTLDKNLILRS